MLVATGIGVLWPLLGPVLAILVGTGTYMLVSLLPFPDRAWFVPVVRAATVITSASLVGLLFGALLSVTARRSHPILVSIAFLLGAACGGFLFWPLGDDGIAERLNYLRTEFVASTWLGPIVACFISYLISRRFHRSQPSHAP